MLAFTVLLALVAAGDGDRKGPAKVRVRCKAEAQLRGADVQLRDLADVDAADAALTARVLQMSFGKRPAPGFNRVLSSRDVLLRLVQEGLKAEDCEVGGAAEIVLLPLSTLLNPKEQLEVAEPVLRAVLERDGQDVEFEPAVALRPHQVPPGRRTLDLRARLREGSLGPNAASIELVVLVDDEEHRVIQVPFRVQRFAQVLVAAKAVKAGEPLGEHNLGLQRVAAPHGTALFVTGFGDVQGKVAARDLRAGERLALAATAPPAVVYKGDTVTLIASQGRVQVTARAIAREAGPLGGRILVASLASGKVVQAVVLGPGVVSVTPEGRR